MRVRHVRTGVVMEVSDEVAKNLDSQWQADAKPAAKKAAAKASSADDSK